MTLHALNEALYTAIGGTLTTAGTSVYYLEAPDNQALPYVIWDYVADRDENLDANRTRDAVVSIRAYSDDREEAATIDSEIDALLHLNQLTVTGWTNFWLARENGYSLPETDKSKRHVYMVGADYRIRLDQS